MLYAYFDETEDENFFIVGGVASESEKTLGDVIHQTRKYIKEAKKGRHRDKLLNEIKEYDLHRNKLFDVKKKLFDNLLFQKKKRRGKTINDPRIDVFIFYMKYSKQPGESLKQIKKGTLYIKMIRHFLDSEKCREKKIHITYDEFEDKNFELLLDTLRESNSNLVKIAPGKSNEIKELQIADVCVGSYRRKLNDEDVQNSFGSIEHLVSIYEIEYEDVIPI